MFFASAGILSANVNGYDNTYVDTTGGYADGYDTTIDPYVTPTDGGITPSTNGGDTGSTAPTVVTSTWGTPHSLDPAGIEASNERRPVNLRCTGESVDYTARRLIDGDTDTGWGASSSDGSSQWVRVRFAGTIRLTRIGLIPGYARVGPRQDQGCSVVEAFGFNRFVQSVEYRFDDGSSVTRDFDRSSTMQWTDVDVVTSSVVITIRSTDRPAGADDDTVVSEAAFEGAE